MKTSTIAALLAALLFSTLACHSTDPAPIEVAELRVPSTTGDACVCGTPHGDLYGCHCEDCLLNGGNPHNAACTCLPLRPAHELDRTFVGFNTSGGARPMVGGALVGLDEIKLKRGGKVRGEVLADDGEEIRFKGESGEVMTYAYDELDFRMVYRLLKAKGSKANAEDELKLATYARDCGLYAHSRRHYANVLELDAKLESEVAQGLAELRRRASESELAQAREAYSAGDVKGSREHLTTVLNEFPEEEAAGSAAAMLGEINAQAMSQTQKTAAGELPGYVVNELAPIGAAYEAAASKNADGLRSTKNPTRAKREYESALKESERARRRLADMGKRSPEDEVRAEGIAAYDRILLDLIVDVRLNLSSLYLMRGKYQDALKETNEALAVAPESERAIEMRSRVESTQNSYDQGYKSGYGKGKRSGSVLGLYGYGYYPGRGGIGIGRISGYGHWGGGLSIGF